MSLLLKYRPYIIFSLIILVGLSIFFFVSGGYYPILSVNGRWISARTFWKNYRADSVYYQNFVQVYKSRIKDADLNSLKPSDLKRSVLTELIESILVDEEVRKELGSNLGGLVEDRIGKINQDSEFKKTAEKVYGLDYNDFKDEVLVPLAKEEILAGRLFLQGKKLDDWLASAKHSSKVKVFSTQFYWDGSEIKLRAGNDQK